MDNTPDRQPYVTTCRCCHKPFGKNEWQAAYVHPIKTLPGKFLVTCLTPGCPLEGVTATDECYTETTDDWLPPKG